MRRRRRDHRRQRGIQLPAAAALCLAASLLVFAHAGGEQTAESVLAALASSPGFVSRALALELGTAADSAEIFVPRAAAASRRTGEADEPQAESVYLPAEEQNDAPILSAADKAATVTINNDTSYEVDVAACLAADAHIRAAGDGPQVLVFHTHSSESYTPDAAFPYTPTEIERTTDTRYNVVRVGDELCSVLEQNGIETIHIRDIFDSPTYSGAYDRALARVEDVLAEHPSIKAVIDVHRDSILTDDGRAYKTACTIGGEDAAQLMFVVGTDEGGLTHPDWRENLNNVVSLQYALNRAEPGLMRPVNLRTQRFDQHASPGSMLVEVGSSGNTMTEALRAIRRFGEVLAEEMKG